MTVDVSKLSKWAQDYIKRLENRIDELEEVMSQPPKSEVQLVGMNVEYNLPKHSTVRFFLGGHRDEYIDARVAEVHDGPLLKINAGMRALIVLPSASNSINIRLGR